MSWRDHSICHLIAALIIAVPPLVARGDAWAPGKSNADSDEGPPKLESPAPASFSDIVALAQHQGWRMNLRDLCRRFGLAQRSDDCIVRQLSFTEVEGPSHPRSFNVPATSSNASTDVLLFHLNPLMGEFFVVSSEGFLKAAFLRSKGTDYEQVANEVVRDEFDKDLAYWRANYLRMKEALSSDR